MTSPTHQTYIDWLIEEPSDKSLLEIKVELITNLSGSKTFFSGPTTSLAVDPNMGVDEL